MALSLAAAHQLPPPARKENGVETVLSGYVPLCSLLIAAEFNSCQSAAD